MMRRMLVACSVEWAKNSRTALPYIGIAIVAALAASTLLIHPVARDGSSDFGFIGQAVPAALNLAGFLMILVYSAALVASDVESGVIRTVLVRPIHRHEVLLAKLISGMAYATILAAIAIGTSWACVAALGEMSGVAYGGDLMFATNEIYAALLLAATFNLLPYFAGVAVAVFISALWRRPAAAIGTVVGGWLVLDYIKYPLGISRFVFTTYLDRSWIVFQDHCNALDTPFFPNLIDGVIVSTITFIAFALAAIFVFGRRSFAP